MMTESEAKLEAQKRERNKSKHLSHKVWRAMFTEEKGWHVALTDNPQHVIQKGRQEARDIFFNGGTMSEFNAVCERTLLARCQQVRDEFEGINTLPN